MTTVRTKQQVACDGVKVFWCGGDSFTRILQHQVQTKFSMDGVIPNLNQSAGVKIKEKVHFKKEILPTFVPKPSFGSIDGVRLPWKQVSTA